MLRGLIVLALPLAMGCSVIMAISGPGPKDTNVLAVGTPRETVVGELGAPENFQPLPEGGTVETHTFKDGLPWWANILRGTAWAAGDVFTLCFSELVTFPLELGVFNPSIYSARIIYDSENRVRQAIARDSHGTVIYSSGSESGLKS